MLPDEFPVPAQNVTIAWQAVEGDVLLPVDHVDWLGASLSILVAAIHHPQVLADQQPDTDASEVASEVLQALPELLVAARTAARQRPPEEEDVTSLRVDITREGEHIRISPGDELVNLVLDLETFAEAVLDPRTDYARITRGAIAYSASAWSRDLGVATGALRRTDRGGTADRRHDRPALEPAPAPPRPHPSL